MIAVCAVQIDHTYLELEEVAAIRKMVPSVVLDNNMQLFMQFEVTMQTEQLVDSESTADTITESFEDLMDKEVKHVDAGMRNGGASAVTSEGVAISFAIIGSKIAVSEGVLDNVMAIAPVRLLASGKNLRYSAVVLETPAPRAAPLPRNVSSAAKPATTQTSTGCAAGATKSMRTQNACVCATGSVCTPPARDAGAGCVENAVHVCVTSKDSSGLPFEVWVFVGIGVLFLVGVMLGYVLHHRHKRTVSTFPLPHYMPPNQQFPYQNPERTYHFGNAF